MPDKIIYLYLILLPLMKLPKPAFMGGKVQYADLVFIPLFVLFIYGLFRKKLSFLRDKINIFLLILVTVANLSFWRSGLNGDILPDFLGLVYLVCLFFVLVFFINKREQFIRINFILFFLASAISVLGMIIFILYNALDIEWLSGFVMPRAVTSQSSLVPFSRVFLFLNLPEMYINFALLGLAGAFVYKRYLRNHGIGRTGGVDFCIALIALSAFFSFSRSLAGLLLFLTLMLYGFYKKSGLVSRALRISCFCLFVLIFVFFIVAGLFEIYPVSFSPGNINALPQISFNSNLESRFYLAKAAVAAAGKHPFLGIGLGAFTDHFTGFLNKADIGALSRVCRVPPPLLRMDPHSLYFGAVAELGYLGLAVLLFTLSLILRKILKGYKEAGNDTFLRDSCYIFLCVFLGYLLNGLFVDMLSMRSFWVLLGLAAAVANLAEGQNRGKAWA